MCGCKQKTFKIMLLPSENMKHVLIENFNYDPQKAAAAAELANQTGHFRFFSGSEPDAIKIVEKLMQLNIKFQYKSA